LTNQVLLKKAGYKVRSMSKNKTTSLNHHFSLLTCTKHASVGFLPISTCTIAYP